MRTILQTLPIFIWIWENADDTATSLSHYIHFGDAPLTVLLSRLIQDLEEIEMYFLVRMMSSLEGMWNMQFEP